jgi:DNA-directed RNA polymerase alpha subunit
MKKGAKVSTNDPLTPEQKEHIELIFHRYEENLNRQYDEAIKGELELLRKYKADLARAYDEVRGQRKTLVSLMEDIVNRQEELIGITIQINEFIYRIENFFLTDTPPKQPEQVECIDHALISEYLDLTVRTIRILNADNFIYMKDLLKIKAHTLYKIPNLGKKSFSEITEALKKKGLAFRGDDV